ncbi:MAG: hypothetical protein A2Z99_07180 [Treponema sp. GWB1_62_6]|nr:MAG: hypothetical protein A2Y36_11605 [Treponema sp. GWA1_62_8]OHE62055.1 MAG: hypothetical protein A2Z99_07180 [Treponema sp. GWB1_62_6]OHE65586.1 MAG: hypothetical protein A2001_10235 [Treponema sp. GWC1_61_84]OHE73790.1 MAG: hypothetical protein A2413_16460 [Treponema sp. RIFOXYC1_FULL_61_9]
MPLALPFFAAFTIFGVASPFLPVLVRSLGYEPALVGILLGIFEVAGIAGPFLLGRLSDRLGRYRPSLALALALALVSLGPLALFRHPALTALALVVFAIGLRSILPLLDATATLTLGPGGDYGRPRAAGSVSFVLMALFLQYSSILPPHSPARIAFWIAVAILGTLASLSVLPDRDPAELKARRAEHGAEHGPASRGERRAPWDPAFLVGLAAIALGRLAMAPISSFFSLYVVEELKVDAVALMWALSAGSEIPFMYFSTWLIRRFGPPRLLAASVVAVAARLAVYALFPTFAGAVAGQLLHSLCFGLFHPAAVAFVATKVPKERRGVGMAMYLSLGNGLPTFLGSTAGGFIVEAAGYRVLFASFIVFALASLALFTATMKALEAPGRSNQI